MNHYQTAALLAVVALALSLYSLYAGWNQ